MDNKEYKRFTISLPKDLFRDFETFRKIKKLSRSECMRKAMKAFMVSEENIPVSSGNVVGSITMIFTHEHFSTDEVHSHDHSEEISSNPSTQESTIEVNKVIHHDHSYSVGSIYADVTHTDLIKNNDIQHHFADIIISTTHVHLAFEKCLEIIAVQGPMGRIQKLKDSLQQLKSVLCVDYFIADQEIK